MKFSSDKHSKNVEFTSKVVEAYVSNNRVANSDLASIIHMVNDILNHCLSNEDKTMKLNIRPDPAVSIKKSVSAEYIICLEDGKRFKSMKRHLATKFGMTPNEYRSKWGLPADYPMVASAYGRERSRLALKLGLGKRGRNYIKLPD